MNASFELVKKTIASCNENVLKGSSVKDRKDPAGIVIVLPASDADADATTRSGFTRKVEEEYY